MSDRPTFRVPSTRARCSKPRCPNAPLADERRRARPRSPVRAPVWRWLALCRTHLCREVRDLPDGSLAIQWQLGDQVSVRVPEVGTSTTRHAWVGETSGS